MHGAPTPSLDSERGERGMPSPTEPVRVLAVVGSEGASSMLPSSLAAASFSVTVPEGAEDAVALARRVDPHIVLIDLAATGCAGFSLCRELRTFSVAYIVMLGGRDGQEDRRLGLAVGVDEFVDRLSSSRDVIARLQAMLSRPDSAPDDPPPLQRVGDLAIDLARRTVHVDGAAVHLTQTEFDLLATLASHPSRVVSRPELLRLVWGTTWTSDDHLIDVHMSNLRRKIGDTPGSAKYIRTVRGAGYRIVDAPPRGSAVRG